MTKENTEIEIVSCTTEDGIKNLIKLSKESYIAHQKSAWYWDQINTTTNIFLIILSGTATVLSVLDRIPEYIVPILTGLATNLSALVGFLKPYDKRNRHIKASKHFKLMAYRIEECRSIDDYHKLRSEFYDYVAEEPFLEKKYIASLSQQNKKKDFELNTCMRVAILKEAESFKKDINQFKENDVLTNGEINHLYCNNDGESR